ncbi:unnamed protein product [Triticum turgidum subsp. durum]|uniref:Uncharacterized protein n=1 Tax=Triticum turgidum subsp. durum TaxID=4567 RepID=A0A9R0QUI5_TRITD|nr:unnamed protein product [Triticum turgidum subsp. durum]
MAAAVDLEDAFGAVFGEAKPEGHPTARPVLFRAHARSAAALRVVATDCHSLAWDCSLSVSDLDDLRDDVGIGGSWADFLDYLKSSLSSGEVKLLFATDKLHSVTGATTSDIIAEFSLALYGAYRTARELVSKEQEQMSQLMGNLSTEREKNEIMQKQLESLSFLDKRKATKPKLLADQVPSVSAVTLVSDQVTAPVQQQISVPSPSKAPPAKVTKRVAPTSRRARVRGALLQDNEDEDDN